MSAIRASHVYKIFGRRPESGIQLLESGKNRSELQRRGLTAAVIDASFEVEPGEIFVVMGLSGSGKSTLIRMVNGLLPLTGGEMYIHDRPLSGLSKAELRKVRRDNVSMVFQHFALLPHRTVGENAAYGLKIKGLNRTDREAKANEALEMVGLGGWGGYRPDELSGGMQQRVGLARALAAGTDIMLMDEAFSALDPLIRRDMQDQLIDLQQKLDKTILFITHDLNEAMRLGDRIAMMRDGRIEQIGSAEQILNDPASNYVAKFVSDVDRTRVLTAGNIAEPPYEVITDEQGPLMAQKILREHQPNWLLVVGQGRRPVGMVWADDVAEAVRTGSDQLPYSTVHELPVVHADTPINELFEQSAQHLAPLVVVDDNSKLVGVVPRVTLLSAATPVNGDDLTAGEELAAEEAEAADTTGARA